MINYECPDDDKTYVHRIGRTGRAGATGIADHLRRLGGPDPVEGHQQHPRAAVREPQETYSTSAHLFHDLGIDPKVTGRLVPPSETPERERPARDSASRDKPSRDRDRGRSRSAEGDQAEKAAGSVEGRKKRSRQRLRNGVPIEAGANGEQAPVADAQVAAAPVAAVQASVEHEGDAPKRRRRRRGGRNRSESDAPVSA